MITFKDFLAEGWHEQFRVKLIDIKREVADLVGVRRYQIDLNRTPEDNNGMGNGKSIRVWTDLRDEDPDDRILFANILQKVMHKKLTQYFGRYVEEVFETVNSSTSPSGEAVYGRYRVPDYDDML
jgi:hypothetical protein